MIVWARTWSIRATEWPPASVIPAKLPDWWPIWQFFLLYGHFPIFSKSMPLSHFFFDNPSRSVFLLRFMSRSQTKILFFFIFIPLFSWVVVKIAILPNLAPLLTPHAWPLSTLWWFYYKYPSWLQLAPKSRFKKWFSLISGFFKVGGWFIHFWPFGVKKTPLVGSDLAPNTFKTHNDSI